MDPIQVGILSILPPLIAIVLALITKEVIPSLLLGIIAGAFIYTINTGGSILKTVEVIFNIISSKIGENAYIIIFISLLGALVVVVTKAGGSQAYGKWVCSKIKKRSKIQFSTSILSLLLCIDDYFNCITVGTVMRPVMDKNRVSRAKFAYLIDSTAAPMCILAPISSWAASVVSYINTTGLNGMSLFMSTIAYNLYAILTIIMIVIIEFKGWDFGPMLKFEKNAIENGDVFTTGSQFDVKDVESIDGSKKGRVFDLIIPVGSLIIFSILSMVIIGGYFNGGITLADAFRNTDAAKSITYGAFGALIVAFILFIPRRLLSFKEFMESITQGIKSMVSAFVILILAWSISAICRELLSTGEYVGDLVATLRVPTLLIPCTVFLIAGLLSFAMGTSWGTFGILIPIVIMVCERVSPELTVISLSATLAGSVFGDHASPISDTTILASTGAKCNHIDHITTQLPYASLVAGISFIGYIIAVIVQNAYITILLCVLMLFLSIFFLHRFYLKKYKNIKN